eukprot:365855-Chlamydomonas_euryale.AAC.3
MPLAVRRAGAATPMRFCCPPPRHTHALLLSAAPPHPCAFAVRRPATPMRFCCPLPRHTRPGAAGVRDQHAARWRMPTQQRRPRGVDARARDVDLQP